MSKVRNISGEARAVPELGRVVEADEVVDVPDDRAGAYICQTATWADETEEKG
jgi:hypothetical protein